MINLVLVIENPTNVENRPFPKLLCIHYHHLKSSVELLNLHSNIGKKNNVYFIYFEEKTCLLKKKLDSSRPPLQSQEEDFGLIHLITWGHSMWRDLGDFSCGFLFCAFNYLRQYNSLYLCCLACKRGILLSRQKFPTNFDRIRWKKLHKKGK